MRRYHHIRLQSLFLAVFSMMGACIQAAEGPEKVSLGAYVEHLSDFDVAKDSFHADFWFWTLVPKNGEMLIDDLDFTNAKELKSAAKSVTPEQEVTWIQKKISGTFHYNWDLTNFPFDRHKLVIEIESDKDLHKILLVPDVENSAISPHIVVDGWKITGFSLHKDAEEYDSNFGDPKLPHGSKSLYSRVEVEIDIARRNHTLFWKLTVAAFAAMFLGFVSYFLHVENASVMSPRFSIIAGALFAIVVSMKAATNDLGSACTVTLVDKIHFVALGYILAAALVATAGRMLFENGMDSKKIARLSGWCAVFSTLLLSLILYSLIHSAIIIGTSLPLVF